MRDLWVTVKCSECGTIWMRTLKEDTDAEMVAEVLEMRGHKCPQKPKPTVVRDA